MYTYYPPIYHSCHRIFQLNLGQLLTPQGYGRGAEEWFNSIKTSVKEERRQPKRPLFLFFFVVFFVASLIEHQTILIILFLWFFRLVVDGICFCLWNELTSICFCVLFLKSDCFGKDFVSCVLLCLTSSGFLFVWHKITLSVVCVFCSVWRQSSLLCSGFRSLCWSFVFCFEIKLLWCCLFSFPVLMVFRFVLKLDFILSHIDVMCFCFPFWWTFVVGFQIRLLWLLVMCFLFRLCLNVFCMFYMFGLILNHFDVFCCSCCFFSEVRLPWWCSDATGSIFHNLFLLAGRLIFSCHWYLHFWRRDINSRGDITQILGKLKVGYSRCRPSPNDFGIQLSSSLLLCGGHKVIELPAHLIRVLNLGTHWTRRWTTTWWRNLIIGGKPQKGPF